MGPVRLRGLRHARRDRPGRQLDRAALIAADRGRQAHRHRAGRRHRNAYNEAHGSSSTTARRSTTRDSQPRHALPVADPHQHGARRRRRRPSSSPSSSTTASTLEPAARRPRSRPATTARPRSPSSRTVRPRRTTCWAPRATSRSPRSTCSTTSSHPAEEWVAPAATTARHRPHLHATTRDRAGVPHHGQHLHVDRPAHRPALALAARPARRGHRGQPLAPGGQGGRGHQHDGRRRHEPRGGREPVKLGYSDRDAAARSGSSPRSTPTGPPTHPGEDPPLGDRWAYVASPRWRHSRRSLEQDAIRTAFIYNPRAVETVGGSQILVNSRAVPQRPRAAGAGASSTSTAPATTASSSSPTTSSPRVARRPGTIAGTDNEDTGDGAGSYNGDRTRQAKALDAFARLAGRGQGHRRGLPDR